MELAHYFKRIQVYQNWKIEVEINVTLVRRATSLKTHMGQTTTPTPVGQEIVVILTFIEVSIHSSQHK
jgi:hypothetical protein